MQEVLSLIIFVIEIREMVTKLDYALSVCYNVKALSLLIFTFIFVIVVVIVVVIVIIVMLLLIIF